MKIYTRVAGIGVDDQWSGGSVTVCILVKNDVTLILDELALPIDAVNLSPSRVTSLQLDAGTSKTGSQSIAGFPGMVVGNLAVNVVGDMSLRDTVRAGGGDPGHGGSEVTEEATIISGQGTTGESELAGTVMRKEGVSVLQESDQYKPVVDPEVRNEVGAEDLEDSKPVDRVVQSSKPEQDANIGYDDLSPLIGGEHWSARVEVVGARGVARLTGRVEDQVRRPATQQIACRSEASANGGVTESVHKFGHNLLADRRTLEIFVGGIQGRSTEGGTSLWNEDLVLGQVTGGSVVLAMSNAPRVVWNSETGVKDPTDSIID